MENKEQDFINRYKDVQDGYDENNDKVDGVNVYYDQIDEVVYLVKIILEEMEGKDHGESS